MSIVFPTAPNNANTLLTSSPVVPMSLNITNISKSYPMVVTVTVESNQVNQYVIGQKIVLTVPDSYGMSEANNITGIISAISSNDISLNIDSRQFNTFVTPLDYERQPASIAPAGSSNIYNTTVAPFHALDGSTGN